VLIARSGCFAHARQLVAAMTYMAGSLLLGSIAVRAGIMVGSGLAP
jgi:hypothetical protein